MFGPSLKSVPGCLVSIVPTLIGVPVAFTPGLGPQDEVPVDAVLEPELELPELLELVVLVPVAALVALLELLPPQPAARSAITAAHAAAIAHQRDRAT
jgi:hypothetical protein